MKVGLYFKGKFIELDPIQLSEKEKCYALLNEGEKYKYPKRREDGTIEEVEVDTLIVEKIEEIKHESGAIIHRHIWKPAPPKLKEILKSAKGEVKAPRNAKGLREIIKAVQG